MLDVCGVLTDSPDAGAFWRKLKQRLNAEGSEVVTFCHGLKLAAPDGMQRVTDCANTEGLFRIIQSIPSPRAEPFKRWLAQVGYERVKEIENPELASARARALYRARATPRTGSRSGKPVVSRANYLAAPATARLKNPSPVPPPARTELTQPKPTRSKKTKQGKA